MTGLLYFTQILFQDLDDLLNFVRDATNDVTVQEVTQEKDVLDLTAVETVPDVGNEHEGLSALFDSSLVISGQKMFTDDLKQINTTSST